MQEISPVVCRSGTINHRSYSGGWDRVIKVQRSYPQGESLNGRIPECRSR